MPTLKTPAALTGYSVTAVSRALKDAPDISSEAKERVRSAARQIGYRPNRAGLRLRTGKTQVISLILNTDEEIMGLTSMMINGISDRLRGSNYHLVVTPYTGADDPLDPVRYVVETHSADGVILSRTEPNDRRVAFLASSGLPFATHGRTDMGFEHPWHDYGNERFAFDAVAALARAGARRIGLVGRPPQLTCSGHMRKGFARAIEAFGLDSHLIEDVTIEDGLETMQLAMTDVFRSPRRPDGIVSGAGSSAIAIVAAIEAARLVVGLDVHVAAKQSTPVLEWFRPSLHGFNEDFRAAGRDLADFVLRAIAGEYPKSLQRLAYASPAANRPGTT
ncbi:MAG: LacI family transcriptional regulator [Rhizobiaceae bacterium]|nr:LacI family transcriptional regulator [Rhizobiaceae bacterium]